MSELKFLDYPACSDIIFNPKTCPDCGKLVPVFFHRCCSCHDKRINDLRAMMQNDVDKLPWNKPKPLPDATYYWIVYIIAVLLALGYLYVATR